VQNVGLELDDGLIDVVGDVTALSVGIPLSSATSTTVKSLSIEKKSMTG
jgi:hypothetical protein